MDDIERDPHLREKINLFKDEENINKLSEKELARKNTLSRRLKRKIQKLMNGKVKDNEETIEAEEKKI